MRHVARALRQVGGRRDRPTDRTVQPSRGAGPPEDPRHPGRDPERCVDAREAYHERRVEPRAAGAVPHADPRFGAVLRAWTMRMTGQPPASSPRQRARWPATAHERGTLHTASDRAARRAATGRPRWPCRGWSRGATPPAATWRAPSRRSRSCRFRDPTRSPRSAASSRTARRSRDAGREHQRGGASWR